MSQDPAMRDAARPDDEDLAAFAEGRLEQAMRSAVLERLASDEQYYELYTELLRFQSEEAAGAAERTAASTPAFPDQRSVNRKSGQAAVLNPPSWRRWRGPLVGLAAAAVLALVVAPRLLLRPPAVDRLVADLEPLPGDLTLRPGPTPRSGGGDLPPYRLDEALSFRLGAFLLDAELDGNAAAGATVRRPRQDVSWLLGENVLLADLWQPCAEAGTTSPCVEQIARSPLVDAHALRFGLWSRAVWLACRAGDAPYLSSRAVTAGLRSLDRSAPGPETQDELRELRRLLEQGDVAELQKAVERIAADRKSAFDVLPDFTDEGHDAGAGGGM